MSSKRQLQVKKQYPKQKYPQGSARGARPVPSRTAAASPSRLKAERVQLKAERVQLTAGSHRDRLKAERVQEALRAMPGWRLAAGGYAIDRVRQFPSPTTAADFAVFLLQFAAEAGQHVAVELTGEHLAITVPAKGRAGRRGPLDEAVLDFARALG